MVTINLHDYLVEASRKLGIQQWGCTKQTWLPFVRLKNGLVFHGLPIFHVAGEAASDSQRGTLDREFHIQMLKSLVTIIRDIEFRYLCIRGMVQHANYVFQPGDIVIELGAYLGYYAMYVAQHIGPEGKIIAVELMPENYRVLDLNLKTNFPTNCLAINKGIDSSAGVKTAYTGGYQVCSLREDVVSRFVRESEAVPVETGTVDQILEECHVDEVDFMIIQINGSEIEALEGMERSLPMVRNFAIAAPYGQDAKDHVQIVNDILAENGFEVKVDRVMVYARNTRYS